MNTYREREREREKERSSIKGLGPWGRGPWALGFGPCASSLRPQAFGLGPRAWDLRPWALRLGTDEQMNHITNKPMNQSTNEAKPE